MNLNNLIALMIALARLAKECHFANSDWQSKIAVLASISKTLAKLARKIAFAIAANLAIEIRFPLLLRFSAPLR
jgi:hypothetical protein